MKKIFLLFIVCSLFLVGCALNPKEKKGMPTGPKTDVIFFNPSDKDITIYDPLDQIITTVKPGTYTNEKLYQNYPYYFMDEDIKIEIPIEEAGTNFYLKKEKPENGKKYLCLSNDRLIQIKISGKYYGFNLYEIVDENNKYAYKYSDNIYICSYPSGTYWFNDVDFVKKMIGKELIYSDDIFSEFELSIDSYCWGWPTFDLNEDKFVHIILKQLLLK